MTRPGARPSLLLAVATVAFAVLAGCGGVSGIEEERVYQLPDGVATVDTLTTVATVAAIDVAKRRITLATPDGRSTRHKVGKDFDLGRVKLGEQIGVRVTEELVVEIRDDGTPAADAAAIQVAALEDGRAGTVLESEAVESSARVVAVDASGRKATFQFADGTTRTMRTGRNAALRGLKVGETVILRHALSVLIATTD